MNRVYFSKDYDISDWGEGSNKGCIRIILIPTNLFSLHGWKMAIWFMKSFSSCFIEEKK